ncbi:ABC transporter permease [Corynebacterium sp. ES2794-CONJ1]|uniref:ABC transporter permease n=1 Tax=unclassified Corynebacterium TaxID=2624378 RepID=UPI00216A17F9|nr:MULTISPECIES: ABC transporter permease [unclassified Corynebacterium]MCS4489615.1 ABC transporter permease [Corynebacterium sp. ES2775-CONJ]MCS4491376.1 ABC transporter permease [Corynebacterium sp. ES2715-CONJ3]MCS4531525.1 ABC transporter permease [Corynebacterium sp. ES2730-CONJ]MCU9518913.1 ABC transporter permease [Corynebacterium sp. ES2794-CONJ1]
MSVLESLRLAWSNIAGNKLRSLLTLLGVVIGIASVIAILTLGQALKVNANSSLASLGAADYSLQIQPTLSEEELEELGGEDAYFYFGPLEDPEDGISEDMIERLRQVMGDDLAGVAIGDQSASFGNFNSGEADADGTVSFVNEDYATLRDIPVEVGRGISADDIANSRPVAVISDQLAQALFKGNVKRAIGSTLDFESEESFVSVSVIGVQKPAEGNLFNISGPRNAALMPYSLQEYFTGEENYWQNIFLRKGPRIEPAEFMDKVSSFFESYYQDNPDYNVRVFDGAQSLAILNTFLSTISAAIAAIGGISLFVGGIGVMNIMLITVTERTREIGIRKALGATRRDIRRQFVIEAIVVCMIGGLIGLATGSILGMIGSYFMGGVTAPPLWGILVSIGFCLIIGVFFGWYPANKAAKLDPIEALRYE